ncbi:MAG: sigma-70 family RNA polymerase sigma factor [Bacteroidota bacterium]
MKCPNISVSQQELLPTLQLGGAAMKPVIDTVVRDLCQCHEFLRTVIQHVRKNGGSNQDAEDLLQEGLAQLVANLYENKYRGESSLENYAFGICKFKWANVLRKKSRHMQLVDSDRLVKLNPADPSIPPSEDEEWIWTILGQMNEGCKDLFKLVYQGFTRKEIGGQLNLAEQTVKNKISSCRQQFSRLVKADPELHQYFSKN